MLPLYLRESYMMYMARVEAGILFNRIEHDVYGQGGVRLAFHST